MKNLIIFSLSFFVCLSGFAQDIEKRYFENNPELGGDVIIKSSSFNEEKGEISKTFEIESSQDGAYYLDAWILAPIENGNYPEYTVAVNGIRSKLSLKPQTDGWHSLALTDARKSAATINLRKGINTVAIIGKSPQVPSVEFIKLSSSLSRAGISNSNYEKFVERIRSNTLNASYSTDLQQASSGKGTNGEIYNYVLGLPFNFTQWWAWSYSAGTTVTITAGSSSLPCAIEFFHKDTPELYSWSASSTTGPSKLVATIPAGGGGYYVLLIRSLNPLNVGETTMTICTNNGSCSTSNNCIVTYSHQVPAPLGYPTPANFFTCKAEGDTWLFLANSSGRIKAYNKNGGTTSDGYYWGQASRILTTLTDISYGMVFREYVYEPDYDVCDLYMGLAPTDSATYKYSFPKMAWDNSFVSGTVYPYNNCVAWSVGITEENAIYMFYDLKSWDDFYSHYGYTRNGANADNAAIALWGYISNTSDTTYRHASVRKNSVNTNPHGFEWESKIGFNRERIMHTRDALIDPKNNLTDPNSFGSIIAYYRPVNGTVNKILQSSYVTVEPSFSTSDLNRIATLKHSIPTFILSDFNTKYLAWEKTWDRSEVAIQSDPFMFSKTSEYEDLLKYCITYGKVIWPLLFEKLEQKDIFVINLLRDLTYTENRNFVTEMMSSATVKTGEQYPTLYSLLFAYCKGLLTKEDANISKSIQAIPEALNINVIAPNSQEILLNLNSGKDEKAEVKIYDIHGKLEYKANHHFSKGNQKFAIHSLKLKKGIHIVKITVGGKTVSQTINL